MVNWKINLVTFIGVLLIFASLVSATSHSELVISDLDVKVDSKSDKNLENDDRINEEAKPGSEVEFEVEVSNLITEVIDLEIKDVELVVSILGIDDDDDLEEESKEFDIKASTSLTKRLTFDIPLEVDEGVYDVFIEVDGIAENGTAYSDVIELELEVEKEDNDVRFLSNTLSDTVIQCGNDVELKVDVINVGINAQEGVVLEVVNNELDVDFDVSFDLSDNPFDEDSKFNRIFNIFIPESVEEGTYEIVSSIVFNDGVEGDIQVLREEIDVVELTVLACNPEPPEVTFVSLEPPIIRVGDVNNFEVGAKDVNDDELTFTWFVDGEEAQSYSPLVNEDIGNFNFIESFIEDEYTEDDVKINVYISVYSRFNDFENDGGVGILYFDIPNEELLEEVEKEVLDEFIDGEFELISYEGNKIGFVEEDETSVIFWTHQNDLIIAVAMNEEPINEVMDFYLSEYPSDLESIDIELPDEPSEPDEPVEEAPNVFIGFIEFYPEFEVEAGETLSVNVEVLNEDNETVEDVFVRVGIPNFGIDVESNVFSIDPGAMLIEDLELEIPICALEDEYDVDIYLYVGNDLFDWDTEEVEIEEGDVICSSGGSGGGGSSAPDEEVDEDVEEDEPEEDVVIRPRPQPFHFPQSDIFVYLAEEGGEHEIKVIVSDGVFETENIWNVDVKQENNKPIVNSFFPKRSEVAIIEDGEQEFSVKVADPDEDFLIFRWYVDDVFISFSDSFTFTPSGMGEFVIRVDINDGTEVISQSWIVTVTDKPVAKTFDGNTPDFSSLNQSELGSMADVVLEKTVIGRIDFGSNELDFRGVIDIDGFVAIAEGIVAIDTDSLPALDVPATITMRGLSFTTTPIIYHNEDFITDISRLTAECSENICSNIEYDADTGVLTFDVTHFSSYGAGSSQENKLAITDVDVEVDGNSDRNLKNNDKIRESAEPRSDVEFKIKIENLYDSEDIEIKDINVEVIVENIDDGDDLKEDANVFDLDKGRSETVTIGFEVPSNADEDTYDVVINVFGNDINGKAHSARMELRLKVEERKPVSNHFISVDNVELDPISISCGRNIEVNVDLVNLGRNNENNAVVEVVNNELGLYFVEEFIKLDKGSDVEKTFNIRIDEDVETGTYPILVNTYYDFNKFSEGKIVDLKVQDCVLGKDVKQDVKLGNSLNTGSTSEAPITEISFRDTPAYTASLIILNIFVIGILIVFLTNLFSRNSY